MFINLQQEIRFAQPFELHHPINSSEGEKLSGLAGIFGNTGLGFVIKFPD